MGDINNEDILLIKLYAYFEVLLSNLDDIRDKIEKYPDKFDIDSFKYARSILWDCKNKLDKEIYE